MLDEKEIEQYLNEKGVGFRDESSIVGVIMPNKITYFAGENAPLAAAMCTHIMLSILAVRELQLLALIM